MRFSQVIMLQPFTKNGRDLQNTKPLLLLDCLSDKVAAGCHGHSVDRRDSPLDQVGNDRAEDDTYDGSPVDLELGSIVVLG